MLKVVQAFDRAPIAEIATDDAAALEAKLQAAEKVFRNRNSWLKPHERMAILRRLAGLLEGKREHFARQIAREGGKPLADQESGNRREIRALSGCGNNDGARHFP